MKQYNGSHLCSKCKQVFIWEIIEIEANEVIEFRGSRFKNIVDYEFSYDNNSCTLMLKCPSCSNITNRIIVNVAHRSSNL